jgi:DNA-binding IclR family transcriptional regulator
VIATYSQTLDRGVRILEVLAASEVPLTTQQLADALGIHRSIAYRILRTFESHGLVERDAGNRYAPGVGLAALARSVRRSLQSEAMPELSDVASDLGMTAFLVVPEQDEAVTVATVEPRHSRAHVTYRPGVRHALDRGAPGLALLAAGPPRPDERREVTAARRRGWASSYQEVLPGMRSVATPVYDGPGNAVAAIAVVYVDRARDRHEIADRLMKAARAIEAEISAAGPAPSSAPPGR